jgi:hypothetical protein
MRANKSFITLILFILSSLLFFASVVLYLNAHPQFSNIQLSSKDSIQNIDLPYKADSEESIQEFELQLHVTNNLFSSGSFHIIPDDCLRELYINNKKVDLSGIQGLCSWNHGFEINLKKYMREGENSFHLLLQDKFGKRGIDIRPLVDTKMEFGFKLIASFWVLFFGFLLMRKLQFSTTLSLLFGLGIAIRLVYFIDTPWNLRTHDVDGHIDYIVYIATNGWIPMADECYTCYHPPLYYMLSAGFYSIGLLVSKQVALAIVQLFSLMLSSGFILFILLSLRTMRFSNIVLIMMTVFILFYPSLILHSVRIGNDVLQYTAYAGAFYFYLQWLKSGKGIWSSTFFVAIAIFSKLNGLVIVAVLGMAYLFYVTWLHQWRLKWRTLFTVAGVYMIIIAMTAGLHVTRSDGGVVSNAESLNKDLFVDNSLASYIYFDPKIMIKEAFTDPWLDGKGREYFWNYFWQSSLFGEFKHSNQLRGIATGISALFLMLLTASIAGFFMMRKYDVIDAMPFIMNAVFLVIAAIYLRISIPASCSNDFRYSFPLVLSIAYFLALFLTWTRRRELVVLEWGMYTIIIMFSLLSAAFILVI